MYIHGKRVEYAEEFHLIPTPGRKLNRREKKIDRKGRIVHNVYYVYIA